MEHILRSTHKQHILLAILILALFGLGCGFVEPIRDAIAGVSEPVLTPTLTYTPRPTFTPTPNWTDTPTVTFTPSPTFTPVPTNTPTETPIPTETPTETPIPTETPTVPATETFTPEPPTNTPRPIPPTATFTPAPPTNTPRPTYPFKVAEGPQGFPTNNSWLTIFIGATDGNNTPIGGLRAIGDHSPSGRHIESLETCFDFCKLSGLEGTVKFANTTLEPPAYETGVWNIYLIDGGGAQVSDVVSIAVDVNSPQWYFVLLKR